MKPIKQTVYLRVPPFKISKLWVSDKETEQLEFVKEQEGYFFTPEELNQYTQNVIKQSLETAAENVLIVGEPDLGKETISKEINISKFDVLVQEYVFYPSKQSITNTFEETFKQFKV